MSISSSGVKQWTKFLIAAKPHLNYINSEFQVHYNREPPHERDGIYRRSGWTLPRNAPAFSSRAS
jgi:hypothetical protein